MLHKFDYSKLRGRIKSVVGNETEFAPLLGVSAVTLSAKLNNKVGFSQKEMEIAISKLSTENDILTIEDIPSYFFCRLT